MGLTSFGCVHIVGILAVVMEMVMGNSDGFLVLLENGEVVVVILLNTKGFLIILRIFKDNIIGRMDVLVLPNV